MNASSQVVSVEGRRITLTHLDKVLYPETGTTKADVLAYYAAIADVLIPHAANRPATRKRWVHGVGTAENPGPMFFQKNLEPSTPSWVKRREIQHKDHVNSYPLVNDLATLTWLAQMSALEIHVPQWQFSRTGTPRHPDRLVLDLDPGEGVGLLECAEVARLARSILQDMGLQPLPVTSGSKGIHLYAALDLSYTSDQVSGVAHELARALEADHRDLVVSEMKRSVRPGKVFVDWSQNNAAKTTITPYSLRGRSHPMVATPRTWKELASADLAQLDYKQVLARLKSREDPLAVLTTGSFEHAAGTSGSGTAELVTPDRLTVYRDKRDARKTPEPVPSGTVASESAGRSFVIQEHHARSLHWDFRLEHDGVLVSWALPRGVPVSPAQNRLAVHVEDHPLEYGSFEGNIPVGEYGAGDVSIWDRGDYDLEKWRDDEIIVTLHGEPGAGLGGTARFALIRTSDGRSGAKPANNWLIHRMKTNSSGSGGTRTTSRSIAAHIGEAPPKNPYSPMLAAPGSEADLDDDGWAFEMKWDGMRALAYVSLPEQSVRLVTRNGHDVTVSYPDLVADLLTALRSMPAGVDTETDAVMDAVVDAGVDVRVDTRVDTRVDARVDTRVDARVDARVHPALATAVLDGEIVAVDKRGRPDFGLLQTRMKLTEAREVASAAKTTPVQYMLFDLLEQHGRSLTGLTYSARRDRLASSVTATGRVHVPPRFDGDFAEAFQTSYQLGLEGVMAKRLDGRYSVGRRSRDWVKIRHFRTQEVVVGGWRPGRGNRSGTIGSLLLGVPTETGLRYIGRVGTGFAERDLTDIRSRLTRLVRKTTPFNDIPRADAESAVWVRATLVAEVEFAEWTATGRLRQPSWRGWRPDKAPGDIAVD
ncbi:non-homologous end-joining DNA ligase [Cryobacterium sp. PH29-G1]|uniref:non-homologous end-joining DNA ligase n=1 Tax=Cryobacterium sp. PH29-G1 TaxID=3046211 RepID=UPI0024BAAE1E|nr:non-homologous end-joining DNA ligase [Cryobacterium sp. PH29-G1]MDJ0349749.1 non-homologous end-joining DNA ligase [Cryobacterium sp. PH29-G1]